MNRLTLPLGLVSVATGIVCNQWVLSRIFSLDGQLENRTQVGIWLFQTLAILLGTAAISHRRIEEFWDRHGLHRIPFNVSVFLAVFGTCVSCFLLNITFDFSHVIPEHPLFPAFFSSPVTMLAGFALAVLATCGVIVNVVRVLVGRNDFPWVYSSASAALTLAVVGRLWHAEGYFNAIWVVHFWAAIWIWWLGVNIRRTDRPFYIHAVSLGHAVLGVVFLGGAVGKLTPDYWNGTAIYENFFVRRPSYFVELLTTWLDQDDAVRAAASSLGRATVVGELTLGASVLIPTSALVPIAALVWVGMILTIMDPTIPVLIAPLAAILAACWLFDRKLR